MEEQAAIWISFVVLVVGFLAVRGFLSSPQSEREVTFPPKAEQEAGYRQAKVLRVIDGDTVIVVKLRTRGARTLDRRSLCPVQHS